MKISKWTKAKNKLAVTPLVVFHLVHKGMQERKTALERAFELASSGKCLNVTDIAFSLKREGYSIEQIQGPMLKKQLFALIEAAMNPSTKD